MSKEDIAKLLNTSPEALAAFETLYEKKLLSDGISDNFFKINAKQAASMKKNSPSTSKPTEIIDRIVFDLTAQTEMWSYKKGYTHTETPALAVWKGSVSKEEILSLPESIRPELTGDHMKIDCDMNSSKMLLETYKNYLVEKNPQKKQQYYNVFRQGLDISDLDPITYEIIGTNPNSMGYWLPKMADPVTQNGFFKIPDTKIIKVPLTMLQLTRLDYMSHTKTTLDIVNRYCMAQFGLDEKKDYFIKTGTYSSKFDFRNAHVHGTKEVRELGEYLLFIHTQALSMAHFDLSGRNQPVRYGVSTTNEWVVREFIPDKEHNMEIYHGLPLHTEYRVFVDFDKDTVLGIHPYWDPDVMKDRFANYEDADDPDMVHDYITYSAAEEKLMSRYEENKERVVKHLSDIVPYVNLSGQWSIDIMQNGDDFWFIDMAVAEISAFYRETVPPALRNPMEENWLPDINHLQNSNFMV